jgi:hypothetical protein
LSETLTHRGARLQETLQTLENKGAARFLRLPQQTLGNSMNAVKTFFRTVAAAAAIAAAGSASAVTVAWTDWTAFSGTAAGGTMGGIGVSVSATAPMNGVTQISGPGAGCGNYWTEPNAADRPYTGGTVSNAPTPCEQLGMASANSVTVNFSSPVAVLYMALLSVGQPGLAVTYTFDQAFMIDSEGQGFWGNDATDGIQVGNTLTMREFHGVLRFNAPVSSLTFSSGAENWQAFTFGTAVPEPASLLLVGGALLAAGAATRRRKA